MRVLLDEDLSDKPRRLFEDNIKAITAATKDCNFKNNSKRRFDF